MYKKIMVVVWKWNELLIRDITQELMYVAGFKEGLLICINEEKTSNAKEKLLNLLREYPDATIFYFLHRGKNHFYNSEDVRELRSKMELMGYSKTQAKFFLFGGGSDYLYFEHSENGLIDTDGDFMTDAEYEYKNGEISDVKVLNDMKEIKYSYFINTWQYYQQEFTAKIQQLYLDFMDHFIDLKESSNNQIAHPPQYWIENLQRKKYLWLQLKSFLRQYDGDIMQKLEKDRDALLKRKRELQELQNLEYHNWQSYSFDDCIANYSLYPTIEKTYNKLTKKLSGVFLDKTTPLSLAEFQHDFDQFLFQVTKN